MSEGARWCDKPEYDVSGGATSELILIRLIHRAQAPLKRKLSKSARSRLRKRLAKVAEIEIGNSRE